MTLLWQKMSQISVNLKIKGLPFSGNVFFVCKHVLYCSRGNYFVRKMCIACNLKFIYKYIWVWWTKPNMWEVSLGFGKLWFFTTFWHYMNQTVNWLIEKRIERLIISENVGCSTIHNTKWIVQNKCAFFTPEFPLVWILATWVLGQHVHTFNWSM